jgi:HTH-type transcriptional regulator, sugar sensing transcriptional regulator
MITSAIIKRSKNLGLNVYEMKCYIALLERETLGVTEIAKLANIPRVAAYEALEKLLEKGFCTARPGKVKQYSAVNPTMLQEKSLLEIDSAYEERIRELDHRRVELSEQKKTTRNHLTELYEKIIPLYNNRGANNSPLNYIEILKDPFQIHKRVIELIGSAEKEILSFSMPPFTVPKDQLKEQIASLPKPLGKGVVIRSINVLPESDEQRAWLLHHMKRMVKAGEQVRIIDSLPIKMIIFDEKHVIFQLEDPIAAMQSFTTQIIQHASLAYGMKLLFNLMWERAVDFNEFQLANHR